MNLISARYAIYHTGDMTYRLGKTVMLNLDHVVKIEVYMDNELPENMTWNIKREPGMGVLYSVETINDHSGYALKLVSADIDKLMGFV